jgi:hypothetical protein
LGFGPAVTAAIVWRGDYDVLTAYYWNSESVGERASGCGGP